jgi:hypothetical protein
LTGSTPPVTAEAPKPTEKPNPAETVSPAETADTAEPADAAESAQPDPKQAEEQRGESVVRDLLGATLINTIEREVTPGARFVDADDTSESLFDSPSGTADGSATAEPPPSER